MSNPDFQVVQAGSFTRLEALSMAARSAPGELFTDLGAQTLAGWVCPPRALSTLLRRLRSNGYRLAYS